jgi:hypothetical protein
LDPAPFALADAAGAGCAGSVCADAIAVAPNSGATTRAKIASLERMEFLLIQISDAGVKTGEPNEGSLARERNSEIRQPFPPGWRWEKIDCFPFGGAGLRRSSVSDPRFFILGYRARLQGRRLPDDRIRQPMMLALTSDEKQQSQNRRDR